MSEIYEALKQTEDGDETAALSQPQRRRAIRGRVRIPLFVYGYTPDGEPFYAEAETVEVSAHGALIVGQSLVFPGQQLIITNPASMMDLACTVVSAFGKERGLVELAISFDTAAEYFWHTEPTAATPTVGSETGPAGDSICT